MIEYHSMYSKKIQIHPQQYSYPESWPDKMGIVSNPLLQETPQVESTKNNLENTPQEWQIKIDEFKKNNPIKKYIDDIYQFILNDPSIADGTYKLWDTLIDQKLAELNSLWMWTLNEYTSVLITARDIVQAGYLKNNGWGEDENIKLQKKILETVIRDALNTSAAVQKPQEIKWYSINEFGKLSPEEERLLVTHSPDKIYDYLLEGLNWMSNEWILTKENVNRYIDGINWQLLPILEKLWKDHVLYKIYENKFTQMRALASYDILYDSWQSLKWYFTGNSITKFLAEAEKGKWKDGSIGYENGVFKFYSINEMDEAIMKHWEISWTYDSAWDSYIRASKDDYTKLEWIFGKSSLEALALYIKRRNGISTLVDNNVWFQSYINKKIPNDYVINTEKYWDKITELTIQDDFPNLLKIIKEKGLNMPEQLPKTPYGWIDGVALTIAIIKEDTPPWDIENIKKELDADFENIKLRANNKKWEIVVSLEEYKDWNTALKFLDISTPLEWGYPINGSFDISLSDGQQKSLKKQLEQKQSELLINPESRDNKKKLETIKKLLEIIDADKTSSDASQAQSGLDKANATEIQELKQRDPAAHDLYTTTVSSNAKNESEMQKLKDFQKRNTEIIQHLSRKYNLPIEASELADPQNLNQIDSTISELLAQKERTDDENIFLEYLQRTKDQIRYNSQSVSKYQELVRKYPEFEETLSNIREGNKEIYNNLTPQKLAQYEHIATYIFPEDPVTRMTRDLANMPPGSELSLIRYYSDSDIWNGMHSSISLEDCRFIKDDGNSGTIHFPSYMWIPPTSWVPIQWVESFLSQADLFVRLWFRELVPQIQCINREVSKKYWKWTSSFDGDFDIYELRRVTRVLFAIIGIELSGDETIQELTSKIYRNFPNNGDVRKKLKEIEILTEDSHFREFEFKKQINALNIKI